MMKRLKTARCGFTLTEMAIVLAVAGIVLSGLWAAAVSVWRNHQRAHTLQEVFLLVQNVRDYYGPTGASWFAGGTDITQTINGRNLVPLDLREDRTSNTCNLYHDLGTASGGSLHLLAVNSALSQMTMRVRLSGLSRADCVDLLLRVPALSPEVGVVGIGSASGFSKVDLNNSTVPGDVTLPLTPTIANTWCSANDKTNEVRLDFRLRN